MPAECGNPIGQLAGSLTCTIPASTTLTLTVERAVTETCEGFFVTDSATAKIRGQHIAGSPTGDIEVVIPERPDLCDATITVTKLHDTDGGGDIDSGDTPVGGWPMVLNCGSGDIHGATGSDGPGTVVFTIPFPAGGEINCTVDESIGVCPLDVVIGHSSTARRR